MKNQCLTSLQEQFLNSPEGLEKWPMSLKRYNAIVSNLSVDFEEFCNLIRTSWKKVIKKPKQYCIDETIYGYHSRKDATSPQRYCPRKPHPNGLMSYHGVRKTTKGPYF